MVEKEFTLMKNGSNKCHVIMMGVNTRAHYHGTHNLHRNFTVSPPLTATTAFTTALRASPGVSLRVYCISKVFC